MQRNGFLIFIVVLISASALWFYYTHFQHGPGALGIGVRNGTANVTLRDITITVQPQGEFTVGAVSPGAVQWLTQTNGPVPTQFTVFFKDSSGAKNMFSVGGAPPEFRGKVCVVITKTNSFAAHLELEPEK